MDGWPSRELLEDVCYFAACKPDMDERFDYGDPWACLAFQYLQWKGEPVIAVTHTHSYTKEDKEGKPLPEGLDLIAQRTTSSRSASWQDVVSECTHMLELLCGKQ